jgi:hypothetical protein
MEMFRWRINLAISGVFSRSCPNASALCNCSSGSLPLIFILMEENICGPAQKQKGLAYQRTGLYILEIFRVILGEEVDNVSNDLERKTGRGHAIQE